MGKKEIWQSLFSDVFYELPRGGREEVFHVVCLYLEAIEAGGDPSDK